MKHRGGIRAGVAVIGIAALLMLAASSAVAAFEQTGTFGGIVNAPAVPGEFPEEEQLGGVGGMAVNISGAGGVAPGTVYVASRFDGTWVARFEPIPGGGLKFVEAWKVTGVKEGYERCGPLAVEEGEGTSCLPHPVGNSGSVDVDVDQTTGNVYVLNGQILTAGNTVIVGFKPDGSAELARFGVVASSGKTTAETPSQIHESPLPGGIAVDDAGNVYVYDMNTPDNFYHRLMVFKPQTPGDFGNYVYAGADKDIGAGFDQEGQLPIEPVVDAAGHVFVNGGGVDHIEEYDPAQPSDPICSFEFAKGGITMITVNPTTGEPYFFSTKSPKRIHQLSACNGSGKFVEQSTIAVNPERDDLYGLAFDPKRQIGARPPGVLYGAAPGDEPPIGKGQPGRGSLGYIFAASAESPPVVGLASVSGVTATTARLRAEVDPTAFQTHYAFQYLTDAEYLANPPSERFAGAGEAPLGGGIINANEGPTVVAETLISLTADSGYHYRVVAESNCSPSEPTKVCAVASAEQAFHTFPLPGPSLPDARAYEMVSPSQKSGQVLPADSRKSSCTYLECKPGTGYTRFPMQSSPDGNAVVYEGTPFTLGLGAAVENQYLAHRNPATGWQTTNLTPPLLESKNVSGYKAFDPDLQIGLFKQRTTPLTPAAPEGYPDFYTQPVSEPFAIRPLLTAAPPNRSPGVGLPSNLELIYAGASSDLSRVFFEANDALTPATPFAPEATGGPQAEENLYEWADGQLSLVNVAPENTATFPAAKFGSGPNGSLSHAISTDGSHAFWSSTTDQVYVRIDGEETREIQDAGKFLTASADGSKVLLDNGCLYELETETCEDLTATKDGFEGILGQSEDLSHVFFVDSAVLPGEEENEQGLKAQAGKDNLYAWVEGATAFVATLLPTDNAAVITDWARSPSRRTAQASPAGRWVAFLSRAQLTGFDNSGPCPLSQGEEEGPCSEAFLYDSATGELVCTSCNAANTRPLGSTVLRLIEGELATPRYLTDSGRLYFDTKDSLVPADTNGGVEDVYQYEPQGIGSCERDGGCVSLISAGREALDSNFVTIDPSGDNVFFTTRDRLVPADKDQLIDLYDARVGGGGSWESQPAPSPCQGEACQQPAPPPAEPAPNSSGPSGGNFKSPQCKKGQVKRKGKCVKKQKHHKKNKAKKQARGGSK